MLIPNCITTITSFTDDFQSPVRQDKPPVNLLPMVHDYVAKCCVVEEFVDGYLRLQRWLNFKNKK